jgi:hypothetical protein
LADRLLKQVRKGQENRWQTVWSVAIECDASLDVPSQWYDQETILGDLLRQIGQLESDPEIPLKLEEFLPDALRDELSEDWDREAAELSRAEFSGAVQLAELIAVDSPIQRQTLLREAAKLGIDLITIED